MTHVFVIRGDITHLACEAWMLPTSAALGVNRWAGQVRDLHQRVAATDTAALRAGRALAAPLRGRRSDEPTVVLTAVPLRGFSEAEALRPAVDAYFATAARAVQEARAVGGAEGENRRHPLIAMPYFGSRGGGGASRRGEILDVLLDAMLKGAERNEVDAVLVLQDPDAYALAQLKRAEDPKFFGDLSDALHVRVEALADEARSGRLVPFMGAGVSASAGGPTWSELIQGLAERVLDDPRATASLLNPKRDALDQAAALRAAWSERPESETTAFNDLIAEQLRLPRYGLAPALLAALPANEAITLNYDSLFELAAEDVGRPRRVIPRADEDLERDSDRGNDSWLLKLHGSVDSPESIVLTRDDYLGYEQDRAALSSLVKAMLMTRHLLFVGFGLADDHFHEILYDVRRAVTGQGAGALDATVLKLSTDPLDELLWKDDLDLIPMGAETESIAVLGRRLEIFLDALLCFSSDSHSYLLKHGFGRGLTKPEQRLKDALRTLQAVASSDPELRDTPAWRVVEDALKKLGG